MTQTECKNRIEAKLERLRAERMTGKAVIEIDMNQGGIGNVTFYTSVPQTPKHRAFFSGNNGPVMIEKHI